MIDHQSTPRAVRDRAREWAKVSAAEPRLLEVRTDIIKAARLARRRRSCCANVVWYGYLRPWIPSSSFKGRVSDLVGWGRPDPKDPYLSSSAAYDAAYGYLYELLPACRNCGCF